MGASRVGGEILVNTATVANQVDPQMTLLDGGAFVVVWADNSLGEGGAEGDDAGYAVKAQLFTAAGEPVGDEILVNTAHQGSQLNAVVTAIDGGGFVVAWQDGSQAVGDTSATAIRAQLFNAAGSKSGAEVLVNTTTESDQKLPTLVRISDGFAVVWEDASASGGDTSGSALRMRVFDTDGTETRAESLVNTATANDQNNAEIVSLEGGGFVVVWEDNSRGTDPYGVATRAQTYDATGAPTGSEILVNLYSRYGDQTAPTVTDLPGGGFVACWQDKGGSGGYGDGSGASVMARVFNADGAEVVATFRVNTHTGGNQSSPVVCGFDGGFVVVWIDDSEVDESETAIRAQLFDNAGQPSGGEFQINTAFLGQQLDPQVIATPDGGFVVTWTDYSEGRGGATGDASATAVKGQLFSAAGSPVGEEFLVNSATESSQSGATVLATGDGFVVAWSDASLGVGGAPGDSSGTAIKAQVFSLGEPPVVGGLTVTPTWIEGSDPVRIASNATLTDADSTQLMSVTVRIGTGFVADEDLLTFNNTNSATMGDVEGDYDAATGVMTLTSSSATIAQFQRALQNVFYSNSSDAPTGATRTLEVLAEDDDGNASDPASHTLNITANNDAPAGADKTITIAEDQRDTLEASDFGFTDVDGDALASVKITGLPAAGTLFLDGDEIEVGQVITVAQLGDGLLKFQPAADASGDAYASFTFKVTDNGGTEDNGSDTDATPNTITYNVTPVNDAPVVSGSGVVQVFIEGSAPVSVSPNATVSDVDSAALTAATVSIGSNFQAAEDVLGFTNAAGMSEITGAYDPVTGILSLSDADGATAAEWQAALRAVTYSNSSDTPNLSVRLVNFTVSDGTATSAVAGRSVSLAGVNDAPSGADKTVSMDEDGQLIISPSDLGFTDVDGNTLAAVKITTVPTAGVLYYDGNPVSAGDVTLVGSGHNLVYEPADNGEGAGYASFTFQVQDNGGTSRGGVNLDPTPNTITIDVEPANDPAVLSGAGGTAAFTIGGSPVAVTPGLTLTDPDQADFQSSGFVKITGGFNAAEDKLALIVTPEMGEVYAEYNAATGVLYISTSEDGVSAAQMQAALRAVTYVNTSGSPDMAARTFTITSFDSELSNAVTSTVTLATAPEPEPTPTPTPTTPTVDGVPVTTTTGTSPSGTPTQTVTIPVVTSGRTESVGGNTVADIPLVTGSGATLLSAQVPTGYGLTVSGGTSAKTAGTSLTDLIREIQAHTASGSADQTTLTGGGGGFLSGLTSSTPLLVQTVVPTGGGAGVAPLVINGPPNAVLTALVIDTRGLPAGSAIQLNDVDFAAIVGAVTVTGGAGSQTVYGDGASQNLFLGADDDELHGGGGTDTVASAGGADRLYGDDGSDSVSGGVGDDIVHGNAGSDTVSGGEGNDIAYGGKDADRVTGEAGNDLIFGDLGDDVLQGNTGQDSLDGGMGADTVHGGQDNDQVGGGDGNDAVLGDAGDDVIQGGLGADTATGGIGSDLIHGGQGDDVIYGEAGNDWLSGDKGSDTLSGGAGADTFHANAQTGLDWVTDFNFAEGDRVLLDLGTTYAVSQGTSGVVIDIAGGAQMVLAGVQLASLGDGWIGLS